MIAENVVFVEDNDGHRYYIPSDCLEEWYYHIDSEFFSSTGNVPYYAKQVEGEMYVMDLKEVL